MTVRELTTQLLAANMPEAEVLDSHGFALRQVVVVTARERDLVRLDFEPKPMPVKLHD